MEDLATEWLTGRGLSSEEIGKKNLHGPGQILEYAVAQVDIPVGPPVEQSNEKKIK